MDKWKDTYLITTDKDKLNVNVVHEFLSQQSYWSKNIPFEVVEKSIKNSLTFGLFQVDQQIGFARVITDYAVFAYLADVFILPEHRGKGLAKWLIKEVVDHPELQGLKRFNLGTLDAHGLYEQFGWKRAAKPEIWMEIHNPDIYL